MDGNTIFVGLLLVMFVLISVLGLIDEVDATQFQPIIYETNESYSNANIIVYNESGDKWASEYFVGTTQTSEVYYLTNFTSQPRRTHNYTVSIWLNKTGGMIEDVLVSNTTAYISRGVIGGDNYGVWVNQTDEDHVIIGYIKGLE